MTEMEQRVEIALHVLRISFGDGNGERVVDGRVYDAANAVLRDALLPAPKPATLDPAIRALLTAIVEEDPYGESTDSRTPLDRWRSEARNILAAMSAQEQQGYCSS